MRSGYLSWTWRRNATCFRRTTIFYDERRCAASTATGAPGAGAWVCDPAEGRSAGGDGAVRQPYRPAGRTAEVEGEHTGWQRIHRDADRHNPVSAVTRARARA